MRKGRQKQTHELEINYDLVVIPIFVNVLTSIKNEPSEMNCSSIIVLHILKTIVVFIFIILIYLYTYT